MGIGCSEDIVGIGILGLLIEIFAQRHKGRNMVFWWYEIFIVGIGIYWIKGFLDWLMIFSRKDAKDANLSRLTNK